MDNNNLYKKLKFLALCLAIICMVLSLLKKVKAESMDSNLQNEVIDIFNEHFQGYSNSQINNIMTECQYVSIYTVKINGQTYYIADFFNNKGIGINSVFINNYYYSEGYRSYVNNMNDYLVFNGNNNDRVYIGNCYRIISTNNNTIARIYKYPVTSSIPELDNVWYSNRYFIREGRQEILNNNSIPSGDNYTVDIPFLSYGQYFQNFGNNAFRVVEDTFTPITNNTPGFECYKLDTKGGTYFYADFSSLISLSSAVSNSSNFSCDIHLDNTIQTITLDSTSEYYIYDVAYSESYYSFPIAALVPNYNEYDNVWVENVKVINNTISLGGTDTKTFIYISPIVIKGDAYQDGDLVNPDDVVIPGADYQPINNIEIAENTYLVEFSNKDGLTFSEFHNTSIPDIYENNTAWVYMDKSTYTFDDFIDDFLNGSGFDNLIDYITGIHSKDEAIEKITNFLYDNAFTLTSDVVIFVYIDGDWKDSNFTSDDLIYWIYYTASGRLRAISQLLNSSNTNISRQLSISSGYYNYAKSKLNTIDKNLYEMASSQLGFNNSFLNKLSNIDTLLGRIDNVLNKIFNALSNLRLEQLDSIDSKLSTIISNMGGTSDIFNEDDTIAEAIAYYQTHTQAQAVLEDKYSVWFTGYCHFWLQEYGEEEPVNNTRSASHNVTDFASSEKRHILFRTFKVITNIYDKMQEDLLFNRVEELFDYMLDTNSDVSHTRHSYFYDVFNEQNTPTLDYNPYE